MDMKAAFLKWLKRHHPKVVLKDEQLEMLDLLNQFYSYPPASGKTFLLQLIRQFDTTDHTGLL